MYIRRDVIFNEQDFGQSTEKIPQNEESPETVEVESRPDKAFEEQEELPPRQQSERTRQSPVRFGREEYVAATSVQHVAYAVLLCVKLLTTNDGRSSIW